MGGPLWYGRFVNRNGLNFWGYRSQRGDPLAPPAIEGLAGDLRRMEDCQLAAAEDYASAVGITKEQAELFLRTFLGIPEPGCSDCNSLYARAHGRSINLGRCKAHMVYGRA